ncbi:MAG: hypothetical protein HUK21_05675, partial [Fibrobacteraceae bacterium]|nr:hypothetical protein [Fibrobacteraceae bacterium]
DNSILELVEGEEIWHPCLWIQTSNPNAQYDKKISKDSAGIYFSSDQVVRILHYKMKLFWEMKDSLEMVALGNSRMYAALAGNLITMKALNMATIPCDMNCQKYLFENYLLNHCDRLKYLVVSLDLDCWFSADLLTDINYSMGSAKGFTYDKNHDFWKEGLYDGFLDLVKDAVVEDEVVMNMIRTLRGGELLYDSRGWVSPDGTAEIDNHMWVDGEDGLAVNFRSLREVLELAKNRGIMVVGVITPMSPYYANTAFYSRHGLNRAVAEQYLGYIRDMESSLSNFVVFDENKNGQHDYADSFSLDFDHLNTEGTVVFSNRLNDFLNKLNNGSL